MHIVTLDRPVIIGRRTVRARSRDDRHLADRLRRGTARPAARPGRLHHRRQDDGHPDSLPLGKSVGRQQLYAEGVTVTLTPGEHGVRPDPNGLPIHGVLAAHPGWRVMTESANELIAELDFGADPALLASFPFPHLLALTVRLVERTLSVRTTVTATADQAVPLCFGFHPYLQLPELPRAQWTIETPPMRHLPVDDRGLPTGETSAQPAHRNRWATSLLTTATTRSPTARCSRCPAAAAVSRCTSSGVSGGADLRAARRGCGVLRADDRAHRCVAPWRLPIARTPASRRSREFSIRVSPAGAGPASRAI